MTDFQAKSLWRRIVYSWPAITVLAIVIIFLSRPVWSIFWKSRAVAEERQQAAAQLADLQARQIFLQQEVARLQTARGVESEIRKKFPVAKEGEKVIVVVSDTPPATSSPTTTSSWWQELFK